MGSRELFCWPEDVISPCYSGSAAKTWDSSCAATFVDCAHRGRASNREVRSVAHGGRPGPSAKENSMLCSNALRVQVEAWLLDARCLRFVEWQSNAIAACAPHIRDRQSRMGH